MPRPTNAPKFRAGDRVLVTDAAGPAFSGRYGVVLGPGRPYLKEPRPGWWGVRMETGKQAGRRVEFVEWCLRKVR